MVATKTKTLGYAAVNEITPLAPFEFDRRSLRPQDVQIEILYCGVCHSDIHTARNEWKKNRLSCSPRSRNRRTRDTSGR